jgi:hypothetical protein
MITVTIDVDYLYSDNFWISYEYVLIYSVIIVTTVVAWNTVKNISRSSIIMVSV